MKKLLALILVLVCAAAGMAIAGFGVSASGSTGTNVVYAASAGRSADFQSWGLTNTLSTNIISASRVSTNTVGSRVVTNKSNLGTNVFWFDARGFLTNLTINP